MTQQPLSKHFGLNRRYSRSINVERDVDEPESILGYILTDRAIDTLRRILASVNNSQSTRAWTLTGVYGTGKSAFVHYFTSLCAPADSQIQQNALEIAAKTFGQKSSEYNSLQVSLPPQGLFRAVAVGQREPLCYTIVRALDRGATLFWKKGRKPAIAKKIADWAAEIDSGEATFTSREVLAVVKEIAEVAKTDVLLVIDELGKNLEFSAHNPGSDDLYLLQQLAELPRTGDFQVYVIGLLHQAFAEYSQRLASAEKNEWAKIQGRFEDIPFTESTEQMTRLIGLAVDSSKLTKKYETIIRRQSEGWSSALKSSTELSEISASILAAAYPLHPITAIALPMLCLRYAQNDRSLFTFLTSAEPYSFANFLEAETIDNDKISVLKIYQIYDYFVESIGLGIGSRPNLQRWIEIQGLITDAQYLDDDSIAALKTIGILNLITSTGAFRATRTLVKLALMNQVEDEENQKRWHQVVENLLSKGVITYRRQLDELRIWEGSDFDVDQEVTAYVEKERSSIAEILTKTNPLKPLIAQRHSYRTGTLRYFERQYTESNGSLENLTCTGKDCDGLVGYWLGPKDPKQVPAQTKDGKPFLLITAANLNVLKTRTLEFSALKKIQASGIQLQADGVARREVRHRLVQAKRLLDESLNQAFNLADEATSCWVQGEQENILHSTDFNVKLSEVCDRVYSKTPILWNELINRRELTSQGAKARRELIEAILDRSTEEMMGLEGHGPEVAIYFSVFGETNIHQQDGEEWGFQPPSKDLGIWTLWQAIEDFFLNAKDKIQTLDSLYSNLQAPPYGVKQGVIPLLLAAVLSYHVDDVSLYKDGTFIPVLSSEHFELLVKDPSRYGVKHIAVAGLRAEVFRELEFILRGAIAKPQTKSRNATLLSVVKPLFQFVRRLPAYTLRTKQLSLEAQAVLQTLLNAQEPDVLLFTSLPEALGLPAISVEQQDDGSTPKALRKKLVQSLQEIQHAYENLLSSTQSLLYNAFGVRKEEKLREDLRVRSGYLVDQCIDPLLRRFTLAAVEESTSDREWIEALVMIVADKPAESWTDEDVTAFEMKLSDLSRRFKNLEALRTEVSASKQMGFEARRITITRPDGQEVNRMVWLDQEKSSQLESLVEDWLSKLNLYNDPDFQDALVARLAERALGKNSQENVVKLETKQNSRQNGKERSQTHSRDLRGKG